MSFTNHFNISFVKDQSFTSNTFKIHPLFNHPLYSLINKKIIKYFTLIKDKNILYYVNLFKFYFYKIKSDLKLIF